MAEHALTRRGFLAAGAGIAGVAATAGAAGIPGWCQAVAASDDSLHDAGTDPVQARTLCDGCGNHCGMTVWLKDGRVWRLEGDPNHPNTRGKLCGRGQGLASIVYSQDRLTAPLKKNDRGEFAETTWDDALSAIAGQVNATLPERVALFQAGGAMDVFVKRFATALGTANVYSDAAVHDADISAAIEAISGAYPAPDVHGARYIVMLDKSTYDGWRPAEVREFAEVHEAGTCKVVLVDPRLTAFGSLADEWVPVRPGFELAFLLGIAGELVRTNRYDKEFIAANAQGFHEFADQMAEYTLDWASGLTGIPSSKIAEIASSLADAAPHCFVDLPWAGTFGGGYSNSFDTVRMVYLVNALLGNFNEEGGWIFGNTPYVSDDMLDARVVPAQEAVSAYPLGAESAPLAWGDSCVAGIEAIGAGDVDVAFFIETNPVLDYPGGARVKEALEKLSCLVVCDLVLTETAQMADYVLPLVSYLERGDVIETVAAKVSVAAMRSPVIDRVHPETRTIEEIFTALAEACGYADAAPFTLEEYNRAWAAAANLDYDELAANATVAVKGSDVEYGTMPYLRTASGKIDFSSQKLADAGLSAVPAWAAPKGVPDAASGRLRLLVGEQINQTHTYTVDAPQLTEISKLLELDRAWINDETARSLGIADGDDIVLVGDAEGASVGVKAKVTSRIHPEAVWMPAHFGITSPDRAEAAGFGAAPKQLVPLAFEPGTGAAMMNEGVVSVRKAGA